MSKTKSPGASYVVPVQQESMEPKKAEYTVNGGKSWHALQHEGGNVQMNLCITP